MHDPFQAPNRRVGTAVVLLSGGQDSTTVLYWALSRFEHVIALSFDYGQRHRIELEQAAQIAEGAGVPRKVIDVVSLGQAGRNALTDHAMEVVEGDEDELPSTFVAGRNLLFVTLAASYAREVNAGHLVVGACQTDYSGYPDCRDDFFRAAELAVRLALDRPLVIHTPLMYLSKADTVRLAARLTHMPWGPRLTAWDALALSHTCYKGERPACGGCPACKLRLRGFKEAGVTDPLPYAIARVLHRTPIAVLEQLRAEVESLPAQRGADEFTAEQLKRFEVEYLELRARLGALVIGGAVEVVPLAREVEAKLEAFRARYIPAHLNPAEPRPRLVELDVAAHAEDVDA